MRNKKCKENEGIGSSVARLLGAIAIASIIMVSFAQASTADTLVAHWPAEGNADDVSGNGHHGTIMGAAGNVTFKAGVVGQAFSLQGVQWQGTGGYIQVDGALDFAKYDYTIEGWFKTDAKTTQDIFNASVDAGGGVSVSVREDPDQYWGAGCLRFLHRSIHGSSGGTNIISSVKVNDGEWHHFVATRRLDTNSLYIDGVLEGTKNDLGDIGFDVDIVIGRLGVVDDRYFNGLIDEIRVYKLLYNQHAACGSR